MTKYLSLRSGNKFASNRRSLLLLAGLVLTVIVLFPQTSAAQSGESQKWLGSYTFFDTAKAPKRRNSYDNVPGTSYDITIEEAAGGKLLATFNENGVQVYQVYECSVKTAGDKIEFHYRKFAADGVKNLSRFKKGDLLFTLVKTPVGKTTKYLFQPAAYKISRYDKIKRNLPVYFVKQ